MLNCVVDKKGYCFENRWEKEGVSITTFCQTYLCLFLDPVTILRYNRDNSLLRPILFFAIFSVAFSTIGIAIYFMGIQMYPFSKMIITLNPLTLTKAQYYIITIATILPGIFVLTIIDNTIFACFIWLISKLIFIHNMPFIAIFRAILYANISLVLVVTSIPMLEVVAAGYLVYYAFPETTHPIKKIIAILVAIGGNYFIQNCWLDKLLDLLR
jgi:hypothetical protein